MKSLRANSALERTRKSSAPLNPDVRRTGGKMFFRGQVRFRSSAVLGAPSGPPGESEIQRLNPARAQRICAAAGWDQLARGSLNLAVENWVVEGLAEHVTVLVEPAVEIVYPPAYQDIPILRKEYWYYDARAQKDGGSAEVLVRRAKVPVQGIVEIFSREPLKQQFGLRAGDWIDVELLAALRSESGA